MAEDSLGKKLSLSTPACFAQTTIIFSFGQYPPLSVKTLAWAVALYRVFKTLFHLSPSLYFYFFLKRKKSMASFFFFFLTFFLKSYGETGRENLSSTDLLSKWPQQPELSPFKARTHKPPGSPRDAGSQRLEPYSFYFSQPQTGSWTESGAAKQCTQALM